MKLKDWVKIGFGLALGKAVYEIMDKTTLPMVVAINRFWNSVGIKIEKYEPDENVTEESEDEEA